MKVLIDLLYLIIVLYCIVLYWHLLDTHGVKETVVKVEKCGAKKSKDGGENIALSLHDKMAFLKNGQGKQNESHHCQVIKVKAVLFSKRRKKKLLDVVHYIYYNTINKFH